MLLKCDFLNVDRWRSLYAGLMLNPNQGNKRKLTAGSYRVQWDGKDDDGIQVASGLYLYRIEAGNFVHMNRY